MLEGTTFLLSETNDNNALLKFEIPRDWLAKTVHKLIVDKDERFINLEELENEDQVESYANTCHYQDANIFYKLALSDNTIITTRKIKVSKFIKGDV